MNRLFRRFPALFLLCAWLSTGGASAAGVPRAACFPIETLSPELRAKSEALLLKALDGEALYTFVGDLKPMSSGFASFTFSAIRPDPAALARLEEARALLSVWTCGDEYFADVRHFAAIYDNERYADAMIVRRSLLSRVTAARAPFFGAFGITAASHPLEAVFAVEYSPPSLRLRHYGHLFGYPDYAVDFFVEAAQSQERDGKFVKRDFYRVPTFTMIDGKSPFVYAVPPGHAENEADRAIKTRAAEILASYRERRARYIGDGRPGVVALLRDWFDDGRGFCSPANARFVLAGR
ncbi:MAG: hypothetical protein SF339_24030 [Blastocatellia bacterium]|nr:hypothetical protein [Blastocatellia bacterium]